MKNIAFTLLLVLSTSMTLTAQNKTISGVTLSPKIAPAGKVLTLNGGGTRVKFFMKIYVAGLYLQKKSENPKEIIEADEQMSVRLHIISNLMTSENMTRAIREGFDKSTKNQSHKFKEEIDRVCNIFQSEPVKVGDMYEIFYVPGKGCTAFKNGKTIENSIMEGYEFKKAMFGIWLSEDPVDYDLKDGMLNID